MRTFTVTTAAIGAGTCEAVHNQEQTQFCNEGPCPVSCVGSWSAYGPCNATCGGGSRTATYSVGQDAQHGGAACEAADGAVRTEECGTDACVPAVNVTVNSAAPSAGITGKSQHHGTPHIVHPCTRTLSLTSYIDRLPASLTPWAMALCMFGPARFCCPLLNQVIDRFFSFACQQSTDIIYDIDVSS
jgi:hypothetical protein